MYYKNQNFNFLALGKFEFKSEYYKRKLIKIFLIYSIILQSKIGVVIFEKKKTFCVHVYISKRDKHLNYLWQNYRFQHAQTDEKTI